MAFLVSEGTGNFSAQTWYRGEAWQLNLAGTQQGINTTRYSVTTFANAGNLRGIIPFLYFNTSVITVGRYVYVGAQKGTVATMTIASPAVVTHTGHGFVAPAACTISNATPAVITQAAHGLVDGDQVGFSTTGSLPTGLATTTAYFVKNVTANTFEVATSRGGSSVATSSAGSGTHSLWKYTVQFTTTGALPTGVTANTVYYINYIDANTYNLRTSPGAANVNTSGSQSGTHTVWNPIDYAYRYQDDIFGTGQTYANNTSHLVPFLFQKNAAVTTTASGYRFQLAQYSGTSGNLLCFTTNADNATPAFLAWCDNSVAYTTSDAPVFTRPITIDQNVTFKGTTQFVALGGTATTTALAGIICTPAAGNRAYSTTGAGNGMLLVDSSASRTITLDGVVLVGTQAGLYFGTEASPISYANKLTINYTATPTFSGATAGYSCWGDHSLTLNSAGGGGFTIVRSGAYPSQRYATLTADANTGQKDLVVDDASGFAVNDFVYITKNEVTAPTGNISVNVSRHQIASIAGNTITLTANLSTEKRKAGGIVILIERGYGVQEYSTSLSALAYGLRTVQITNQYTIGLYQQGIQPQTAIGAVRFFDNTSNLRNPSYIGYSLAENYQGSQGTFNYFGSIFYPDQYGLLVESCISVAGGIGGSFFRSTIQPVVGTTLRTGDVEVKNCIAFRHVNGSICGGASGATSTLNCHDNILHNMRDGINVSGSNSIFKNNYLYGNTQAVTFGTALYCKLKTNTYENCGYAYNYQTAGTLTVAVTDDTPTISGTTPSTNSIALQADALVDLTVWNPTATLTNVDYTNQGAIAGPSQIRIIRNANTDGSILVVNQGSTSSSYTSALLNFSQNTLTTPGTYTTAFSDTTLIFTSAGTYDLRSGEHLGTLTLSNTSGGSVTVKLAPGISYVNSGPNITVEVSRDTTIALSGLVSGSRVRINNQTDNIELYNAIVGATTLSVPITWTADKTLDVRVTYCSGTTAYLPFQQAASFTSNGATILVSQESDTIYNTNAIDGSTVTEFTPDYPNIQVDVSAGATTTPQRLYAAFCYFQNGSQGIVTFFNGMAAQDLLNYTINTGTADLRLDNTGSTPTIFTNAYLYRDDGTTVIYSGSGSIQMDPKRAYDSKGTAILNAVYGLY